MKRLAAHYLYFPCYGFLKQHVIEITDSGKINRVFPLINEMASVEWLPGILIISNDTISEGNSLLDVSDIIVNVPENFISESENKEIILFRAYPFDFIEMKPLSGTRFTPIF